MKAEKHLIWIAIPVLMSSTLHCDAFEPGFYSYQEVPQPNEMSKIFETERRADRVLHCIGLDFIDIGIGEEIKEKDSQTSTTLLPKYFSRKDLRHFLKTEKHKDLLVMRFSNTIMRKGPEEIQEIFAQFKEYASDFGYKRILILGSNSMGVFVYHDSAEKIQKQAPVAGKEDSVKNDR